MNLIKNNYPKTSLYLTLILGIFSPLCLAQFVGGITTDPSGPEKIGDNQASQVTIRWEGQSDSRGMTTPNSNYTVSSSQGEFIDDAGGTILSINRNLSDSLFGTGTNINDFSIRESLRIPASLKRYMQRENMDRVTYRRTFVDDSNTAAPDNASGQIIFELSNLGTFSVVNLDLRFENRQLSDVIKIDESQRAVLRLQHEGSGRLNLLWELATPASSAGIRLYRRLQSDTISLTGKGEKTYLSPLLPSTISGAYELRVSILDAGEELAQRALSYRVIQGQKQLPSIKSLTPPENSRVNDKTPFSWESFPAAKAYRLEIVQNKTSDLPSYLSDSADSDELTFVTGMLLTPDQLSTQLSQLVLKRIKPGNQYKWRVLAISQERAHAAASQWKSMSLTVGTAR